MKTCCVCKISRPPEEFNKNKSKADGLSNLCRPCDNSRARKYYEQNKSKMIKQIHDASKRRSDKLKLWICEYLIKHPCVDCGETDIRVLEFDHQRDKTVSIGQMLTGWYGVDTIQSEIEKCEVVCANCHKRRTDSSFDNYRHKFLEGRFIAM